MKQTQSHSIQKEIFEYKSMDEELKEYGELSSFFQFLRIRDPGGTYIVSFDEESFCVAR